ncbi:hypothetical protein IG631_01116 [Alternaria alternata]|nr:hypothetical protein IG631_01116 [Alternaria alternata]
MELFAPGHLAIKSWSTTRNPIDRIMARRARNRSHGTETQSLHIKPLCHDLLFDYLSAAASLVAFIITNMTSGTVSSLVLLILSCTQVLAQNANTQQVSFNQVLNVNGDVETFSQKQQQIIVNQQTPAIPANQVTGTTGQPFVAVSPQSMTISTNGATDLVGGQIEMAMTMQNLQAVAVQPDNTYVAMLSPDRQSWMIQETMRSVNTTDMTVRMVKRTQMDGEYMVVGRQTVETNTLVTPFGSDGSTSVAIQGTGLQENEFQDGFRMSTRATQPMTMNVDVKDGVDSSMLAALQGQAPVNDYRYSVVSNLAAVTPDLNQQVTVVQMPSKSTHVSVI